MSAKHARKKRRTAELGTRAKATMSRAVVFVPGRHGIGTAPRRRASEKEQRRDRPTAA